MQQFARLSGGGHEVVPAPRNVRLWIEAKDALADGVAVMMVVEEPAVVAGLAQCRLNRVEVHRGDFSAWDGSGGRDQGNRGLGNREQGLGTGEPLALEGCHALLQRRIQGRTRVPSKGRNSKTLRPLCLARERARYGG